MCISVINFRFTLSIVLWVPSTEEMPSYRFRLYPSKETEKRLARSHACGDELSTRVPASAMVAGQARR